MENFSNFITEQKNTHMTHIEDKVLYGGVDGTRQAINALRGLRDMLSGTSKGNVSVKWDGAPAIFAGQDPRDDSSLLRRKASSIRTQRSTRLTQTSMRTPKEISTLNSISLKYLPDLNIKGVVQGDFLFSRADLQGKKIGGQKYVVFHPNTIAYAVPWDQAADIRERRSVSSGTLLTPELLLKT